MCNILKNNIQGKKKKKSFEVEISVIYSSDMAEHQKKILCKLFSISILIKQPLNNNNKFSSVFFEKFPKTNEEKYENKFHTGELLGSLKDLHHQHSLQDHIFDKSSSVEI